MCWHYIELSTFKSSDGTPPSLRSEAGSPCHPVSGLGSRPPSTANGLWFHFRSMLYIKYTMYHIHTQEALWQLPFSRPAHAYTDVTDITDITRVLDIAQPATHNPPRKLTLIMLKVKVTWLYEGIFLPRRVVLTRANSKFDKWSRLNCNKSQK